MVQSRTDSWIVSVPVVWPIRKLRFFPFYSLLPSRTSDLSVGSRGIHVYGGRSTRWVPGGVTVEVREDPRHCRVLFIYETQMIDLLFRSSVLDRTVLPGLG